MVCYVYSGDCEDDVNGALGILCKKGWWKILR